jgi:hypothetical protein
MYEAVRATEVAPDEGTSCASHQQRERRVFLEARIYAGRAMDADQEQRQQWEAEFEAAARRAPPITRRIANRFRA